MENKSFTFAEMQEIYRNQIASGYEKTFGRVLLGEELCCLSYWLLQDPSNKGYMTLNEFGGLLKAFKFSHLFEEGEDLTYAKLRSEFKFLLTGIPNEFNSKISGVENEEDIIVRFDFAREMFLERGL